MIASASTRSDSVLSWLAVLGLLATAPAEPWLLLAATQTRWGLALAAPATVVLVACVWRLRRTGYAAGGPPQTLPTLVGGALGAVGAVVLAGLLWYTVAISAELCGHSSAADAVGGSLAGLVYFVTGVLGFRRGRHLAWVWPLAVVFAWAVFGGVQAIFPAAHGYCET